MFRLGKTRRQPPPRPVAESIRYEQEALKRRPPQYTALDAERETHKRSRQVIAEFAGPLMVVGNPGGRAAEQCESIALGIVSRLHDEVEAFSLSGHRLKGASYDGLEAAVSRLSEYLETFLNKPENYRPKPLFIQDRNDDRKDGEIGSSMYEATGRFGIVNDLAEALQKAEFMVPKGKKIGHIAVLSSTQTAGLGLGSDFGVNDVCIIRADTTLRQQPQTPIRGIAHFDF